MRIIDISEQERNILLLSIAQYKGTVLAQMEEAAHEREINRLRALLDGLDMIVQLGEYVRNACRGSGE